MSGITEIYISKFGERLEDGTLQTTVDIRSREQAERDAREMCKRDPTIGKIAYYSVRDDGNNRHLLTYTNPENPLSTPREQPATKAESRPAFRLRKPAQPSIWRRITSLFG